MLIRNFFVSIVLFFIAMISQSCTTMSVANHVKTCKYVSVRCDAPDFVKTKYQEEVLTCPHHLDYNVYMNTNKVRYIGDVRDLTTAEAIAHIAGCYQSLMFVQEDGTATIECKHYEMSGVTYDQLPNRAMVADYAQLNASL
jgi:hypothetical protein